MPARWLTESEQNRLTRFPTKVPENDVATFFTLTKSDWSALSNLRGDCNRLGFALQLCSLRYLGFVPENLGGVPSEVLVFLADQLSVSPDILEIYGSRTQTRSDHLSEIEEYLGFHKMTSAEEAEIET